MIWAMSFPCWRCRDCKQVVEWCDAFIEEESGKLVGVLHKECVDAI